ncbi:MAG: hypothetical protein V2A73_12195, partial [Pseudomonadota bacterium]
TRQVQDLEGEGLIRRHADRRDGRRSYVSLSPKGRKLFEKIHERTHELERSLSSVLGAEDITSGLLGNIRMSGEDGSMAGKSGVSSRELFILGLISNRPT